MKKIVLVSLMLGATIVAQGSTLEKFNALVMGIHEGSDEYFVNIPSKTFAEDKSKQEHLNDANFIKAMSELNGKKIYQLRIRKSQITDAGLDALSQFPTIKQLELSNSKITDEGIKKIVKFCPQLKRLNIWGCSQVTDKSFQHLKGLWKIEKLHLFGTKTTWEGANKYRGMMQSMAANESLTINTNSKYPTLYAFKMEELWKDTYQKNVDAGKLNKNFKIEIKGTTKVESNKEYEDDLKKEATEPILNGE